jgi:hypothetical protein
MGDGLSNGDQVLLGPNTLVSGSATITTGGNTNTVTGDQISTLGTINHDLVINMGDNTNTLYFAPQNLGDPMPVVNGNMTVNAGNGTNNIGIGTVSGGPGQTGPFEGIVGLSLTFNLGTGDNGNVITPMVIETVISTGILNWTSGGPLHQGGQDFLQLGNFSADGTSVSYAATITFGDGGTTFIVDIGGGTLSGDVFGNGGTNTNTLISGTVTANFHNFP